MSKSKMKTRKSAVKRFKLTKSGKLFRNRTHTTHLGRKDDSSSKNRKKRSVEVVGKFKKKIKRMIG
ncbi:50S ribosomal protein L35 [candidate division WWE3 bacterium CG_4_9_14_3_um_filter_34_6]|uniref:50S ribosomal protein L35 n=1 Tax=candidate division WWE3 bacterium CG_4_9_14_3_um_filter_34_6 TaxID=1975079 RepID=A0A2M7X5A7_UNCKA|nr:MAG: 50S ribosomal protein L35 [candidate division WWE3 bacterium CG_4_9_14_3_um_filter_34_6]